MRAEFELTACDRRVAWALHVTHSSTVPFIFEALGRHAAPALHAVLRRNICFCEQKHPIGNRRRGIDELGRTQRVFRDEAFVATCNNTIQLALPS